MSEEENYKTLTEAMLNLEKGDGMTRGMAMERDIKEIKQDIKRLNALIERFIIQEWTDA